MRHESYDAAQEFNGRKSRCWAFLICLIAGAAICNLFEFYKMNLKLFRDDVRMGNFQEIVKLPHHPTNQSNEVGRRCIFSGRLSDYCEMEGDIRIEAKSSTIFIVSPNSMKYDSWSIKPYTRKDIPSAMSRVKEWSVKLVGRDYQENVPSCSIRHKTTAIIFSTGGYCGNNFHDISDLLVPIYSTSQKFNGDVQFLVTDYNHPWISKYNMFFSKLTLHPVIPIDRENQIHCYSKMTLGLKAHTELSIDPSKFSNGLSMNHFRQFIRSTYSLNRTKAIELKKANSKRPRLMLISRNDTRLITNIYAVSQMAQQIGYEVIVAEPTHTTNVASFAQLVNSCDVLVGVHGAGLANMVFLPDNAILIQILFLGGFDDIFTYVYKSPTKDMSIIYMEYKIMVDESSLISQYPLNHPVLRDPFSIHKRRWNAMKSLYMDKQDIRINLRRFKSTLEHAIKVLRG